MPYTVSGDKPDDRPNYNEVVSSKPIADAFSERGGFLRGGIKIGQTDFRNFETNSPENLVAQINSRYAETGVRADITEDGRLRLAHQSDAPILLASGANYQPPRQGDTVPEAYKENTVLSDLGFDETTEENAALAAQDALSEGRVPQVGDGRIPVMPIPPMNPEGRVGQTAEEIEATNRAIMQNPRGVSGPIGSGVGGRAPNQPHETVPGTLTTGNRPMPVEPDSNARRVVVQPGQETALGTQPVRADSLVGSAAAPGPVSGSANQQAPQGDSEPANYDEMTVADLKEHAKANDVDLEGATLKDDIIAAIKKHDRKKAREAQK